MLPPIKEYPFALRPMIAAHRGDTSLSASENSLDAIANAMISGAEMIEVDVQQTIDNVFVCHHDETLMFESGRHAIVHRHTYDELQSALANENRSLTKLHDVLSIAAGKIYLNLEIKEYSDRHPRPFMDALERLLREFRMEESVLFSSFRLEFIHEASWNVPSVIIQPTPEMYFYFAARTPEPLVLHQPIEQLLPSELMKASHATSYACMLEELTGARLADIRKHNILLSVYTIASEEAFEQALALGAKALVCEQPSHFVALRNARYPRTLI